MAGIVKTLQFAEGTVVDAPTVSGSGAGEKNYITAGSNASGWGQVGDLDVATTTTAAELPREYTTGSGIKITADANTQSTADYVYYDFTLDDVDLSKKLKIQWSQKTTGTYTAGQLAVVITTQADRTTALHTPITTEIPAADGVFTTSFDASTTATLSLVIRATTDMATNGGIVISDVVVGPSTQVQGAVVGEWQTYTPTTANLGTSPTVTALYRRVGDSMEINFRATLGTTPGSSVRTFSLPSGYTIDFAKLTTASARSGGVYPNTVGSGAYYSVSTENIYPANIQVNSDQPSTFYFGGNGSGSNWSSGNTPVAGAAGDRISASVSVPIAEWAGSGTVNVAQNDVQYVSHDGTNVVIGPAGATIPTSTPGGTSQDYTITSGVQNPTASSLVGELQVQIGGTGPWSAAGNSNYIEQLRFDGTNSIGAGVFFESGNVYMRRGKYRLGTSDTWAGLPAGSKWRVAIAVPGQAVGFGHVAQNSSGLVKSAGQLLGTNTNDSAATGYVGEYVSANPGAGVTPGSSGAFKTLTSISLTAGDWDVEGMALLDPGTGTGFTRAIVGISKTTNTMDLQTEGGIQTNHGTLSSNTYTGTGNRRITVANGATQTVYLVGYADYSAAGTSTWTTNSIIRARRVR